MKFRFLILLFLSGCMVGPNYKVPEMEMPGSFVEQDGAEQVSDGELCNWWKQFEDPLLDAFIEEAAQNNYNYLIALEQIVEARSAYQVQSSYLWPEIDMTAIANRERFSQTLTSSIASAQSFAQGVVGNQIGSTNTNPVRNFFQIGFDAIWELDIWGKFRRGKQAALDEWEKSIFSASDVLITLIAEVARDYVMIRSLQVQIDLLQKRIQADARELELQKVLFNAGLDNEIDVEAQISALETDKAQLPILETSLKQMIYSFAILLGKEPENLAHAFDETLPIPVFLGKVPAGLPSELLRRRPDIRAAERELAAQTELIGVAISGLFPAFLLTGDGVGMESNQISNLFQHRSTYWTIGPSMNWDLIDWGRTLGQIDISKSNQRQALLTYKNTVISALQDVEGALVAFFEEQKRNRDLSEKFGADMRSLVLTEDLFHAGLDSEIQQLAALKTAIDSETLLVQSNQAIASDLISLYKALGGNWECTPTP